MSVANGNKPTNHFALDLIHWIKLGARSSPEPVPYERSEWEQTNKSFRAEFDPLDQIGARSSPEPVPYERSEWEQTNKSFRAEFDPLDQIGGTKQP